MAMNLGSKALAPHVAKHGELSKLARKLGRSHVTVYRWASGERLPLTGDRVALRDLFGIPLLDWDISTPTDTSADPTTPSAA